MRDVTFVGASAPHRARGIKIHKFGGTDGVVWLQDRQKRFFALRSLHNGAIYPIRRIMGVFQQEKKLREGVILALDAGIKPGTGYFKQLREQPCFDICWRVPLCRNLGRDGERPSIGDTPRIRPEIFLKRQFCQQKGNLLKPP